MKRLDLERKLRIAGCYMKREGSSHSLWINPKNSVRWFRRQANHHKRSGDAECYLDYSCHMMFLGVFCAVFFAVDWRFAGAKPGIDNQYAGFLVVQPAYGPCSTPTMKSFVYTKISLKSMHENNIKKASRLDETK